MAPTEQTILTTFLLTPSSLPNIFTFQRFAATFPNGQKSSPEVKRLYRALQHRRALVTDAVAENIGAEVERGNAQRRAVVRARRAAERPEPDDEIAIENALFGSTSNLPSTRQHTLSSIIPSVELATRDISLELDALEEEAASLLADITATVSGLSDLRYGRLSNPQLRQEVTETLGGLQSVCDTR